MKNLLIALATAWGLAVLWITFRPVTSTPPTLPWKEIHPTLSGDGRWLAFETTGDDKELFQFGRKDFKRAAIAVVDLQEGETIKVQSPQGSNSNPKLSGDGRTMIFSSTEGPTYLSEVYLWKANSLEVQRIVPLERSGGHGGCFWPNLSVDGQTFTLISQRKDKSKRDTWIPCLTVGDTSRVDSVQNPLGLEEAQAAGLVAVSPDGQRMAWERRTTTKPYTGLLESEILVWDRDPKGSAKILATDAGEPRLSQDHCVFIRADISGIHQIFLHDFRTGQTRQLTEANDDCFEPVLSKAGDTLAFTSYADNLAPEDTNQTSDIFVMNLPSGKVRRLKPQTNGPSYNPCISADGKRIAFVHVGTHPQDLENVNPGRIFLWSEGDSSPTELTSQYLQLQKTKAQNHEL